jgi:V/A-type H+-transporting ATPase subunit E
MEDKLQVLTTRIYEEGVEKARTEAANILAMAKKEADELLSAARQDAEKTSRQAREEAEDLKKNVASEIRLSGRQALNAIKQEIAEIVTLRAIAVPLSEAVGDKDFLKKIIEAAIKNWNPSGDVVPDLSLILPEEARENLDHYLESEIKKQLGKGIELRFDRKLDSGFRIGPADGSFVVSFSEKDFDNLFREYLRPKTMELLFGER